MSTDLQVTDYSSLFLRTPQERKLEFEEEFGVDLSTGEVIGDGVLLGGDIGDPVVAIDVADAEEVEAIDAEPDVAEGRSCGVRLVVEQTVAHADVGAFIGGSTEGVVFELAVGCGEGEPIGEGQVERHFPAVGSGEVVGEEEVDGVALIGGQGQSFSVEEHAGIHQGEVDPGVGSRHKFAIEFEVDAGGVSATEILTVVDYFDVVHAVGDEVAHGFVIDFGGEFEGATGEVESVVGGSDEVDGTLTFDVAVEGGTGDAGGGGGVAQFFEEGGLIVEAGGQAEGDVAIEGGNDAQR